MYHSLVAVEERVQMGPKVRQAKEFVAIEQKVQERISIATDTWQQEMLVHQKAHPAVRVVEDDWFILLDVATRKSGRSVLIQSSYPCNFIRLFSCCTIIFCNLNYCPNMCIHCAQLT